MTKRSSFEVCKAIFEALFRASPIYKSELREMTGLGARSVDRWVDLITFIQSQPALNVIKRGRLEMLEIERQKIDETIYPETLEALKAMRDLIMLPKGELKRKIELLKQL